MLGGYWMDDIKLAGIERSGPRHFAHPLCLASTADEALASSRNSGWKGNSAVAIDFGNKSKRQPAGGVE
jgi:hypothetical protein